MLFEPGDIVALLRDDRQMVVISNLDARLVWLRLKDSDRDDMYAFRALDLRLIMRASPVADVAAFTTVPQIPRSADGGVIAA